MDIKTPYFNFVCKEFLQLFIRYPIHKVLLGFRSYKIPPIKSFSDLTFPLAVLVGIDNIHELSEMIFDVRIEEEKIVDFIEEHYTDNILKSDSIL